VVLISNILVDIQFKAIKDRGNLDAIVNVVGKGEHAPAIERFIRVINRIPVIRYFGGTRYIFTSKFTSKKTRGKKNI
jgi:hypothetical protein